MGPGFLIPAKTAYKECVPRLAIHPIYDIVQYGGISIVVLPVLVEVIHHVVAGVFIDVNVCSASPVGPATNRAIRSEHSTAVTALRVPARYLTSMLETNPSMSMEATSYQ
jgi:hypothetical protein